VSLLFLLFLLLLLLVLLLLLFNGQASAESLLRSLEGVADQKGALVLGSKGEILAVKTILPSLSFSPPSCLLSPVSCLLSQYHLLEDLTLHLSFGFFFFFFSERILTSECHIHYRFSFCNKWGVVVWRPEGQ